MGETEQISLLSTVVGVAASGPSGPLYATTMPPPPAPRTGALRAFDTRGRELWTRRFTSPPRGLKVSEQGEVWVAHGQTLRATASDGTHLWAVRPDCAPGDQLDAFVLLPDGFVLAWRPARGTADGQPWLQRIARDGSPLWTARLPPVLLGWSHTAPHRPAGFRPHTHEPLLVSDDRLLASYTDPTSGLGVAFCFDLHTGAQVWSTASHPTGRRAIAGPGRFLVGMEGPETVETHLYDRKGHDLHRWDCHGMYLVSSSGTIRCLELDGDDETHSRLRVLAPDGEGRHSAPLGGYHSAYPSLSRGRRAVLCRNDQLWAIDYWMTVQPLGAVAAHDQQILSRTLLLAHGTLAVARDSELLLCDTGLGPLEDGYWPCGGGNVRGNPVLLTS